jgi:DNA-directed RNA polymerase specialized sigma subunit
MSEEIDDDDDYEYFHNKGKNVNNTVNNMSQLEVAKAMGITRSQVDSIEKKAIRKIKHYLKTKKFKRGDLI